MKLSFAILALATAVSAKKAYPKKAVDLTGRSIKADSKLGSSLMSKARRLENDDNEEVDFTWVAGYSIKFQGCHHIPQWNDEADDEDDPKIQTKRLIRFRLCPSDSCTYEDAGGCDSGYGDYIIDMNTFLDSYWTNKQEFEEWNCEYYENNVCDCEDADNEEYCLYDCQVTDNGLDYCWEGASPYAADDGAEEEEEFDAQDYLYCAQFEVPEEERRKLEDGDEVEYFIGPYCSDQGGKVYLGVFTDEYCTNFADDEDSGNSHLDFYESATGKELAYSSESLIDMKCISCMELGDNDGDDEDDGNDNDQDDEDQIIEMCETVYDAGGKCESLLSDVVSSPNENACNYIEGIKIVRQDGVVVQGASAKSKTAAALIGVFAISSVLLSAYVYYLKTKLDRAKINLAE